MERTSFALDPLSAFAIQAVSMIVHVAPSLPAPNHIASFERFILSSYLVSEVGVPLTVTSKRSKIEAEVILKSMAIKAIARACTPLPGRHIDQPHFQTLAERCFEFISTLE